jgi:outer membrane protein assembly factor BamB
MNAKKNLSRVCGLLIWGGALAAAVAVSADDWPQWLGPERDGVWRETGIAEEFPPGGPKLRWRTEVGGGYAGPTVADGRVFVHDRQISEQSEAAKKQNFQRGVIPGSERVLCLEEATGSLIWRRDHDCDYTVSYPAGPRVQPTVDGNRVYTLGAEGNLMCLNVATGKTRWARNLKRDYRTKTPLWGFSGHPLIDGDRLICLVGGEGSVVVAFNKHTGRELWRSLSAREPGYSPPTMIEAGGRKQLIVWHPEAVNSLNPANGRPYWREPFRVRSGLSVATPRLAGDLLLVSSFYNGSMMYRLGDQKPTSELFYRAAGKSERNTEGLHSLMATPFIEGDHIYGVCSYGQFRCLELKTGKRVWETFEPTTGGQPVRWGNAFIVKHEDRFVLHNEHGDLIIAKLSPKGYVEIDRFNLLKPTSHHPRRPVVWSHPAFANRSIYARNDEEIVCYSLAADSAGD